MAALDRPCLRKVMCQQLGLSFNHGGEAILESVGDPAMELLPLLPRQHRIGGILHDRMLECVGFIRKVGAHKDQFGSHKSCECGLQRIGR